MLKGSAWRKNNLREVRKTLGRFIAILAITMLGVGFFAGLKVTKRAMLETGNAYIAENRLYDYRMISTMGLYEEDAEYIRNLDGVAAAEGVYSFDFLGKTGADGATSAYKAISITEDVNRLSLVEGRMPENENECVVDSAHFGNDVIGETLYVAEENEKDTAEQFACREYTITGTVNSPMYLNMERGTTNIGNGSVYGYVCFPNDSFHMDYFTDIYVKLEGNEEIYSDEYKKLTGRMEEPLQDALEACGERKYQEVYAEAEQELQDAEADYEKGVKEYQEEKQDAETELQEAWDTLEEAEEEIKKSEGKISSGRKALADAKAEYAAGKQEYEKKLSEYETQKTAAQTELETALQTIEAKKQELSSQKEMLQGMIYLLQQGQTENVPYSEPEIRAMLQQITAGETELAGAEQELAANSAAAEQQFQEAEESLNEAKAELDKAAVEIQTSEQQLSKGETALKHAKKDYQDGLSDYQKAKEDAEQQFQEAEAELQDAETEIKDGWEALSELEKPEVYLLDRSTNVGYASFENDSGIVDGIAKVFPIFFFMVAALVCITTMTRMVDEQRTQIGTLKALGYRNASISMKYISYSGSAAMIGCVLGFLGGSKLFPWAIWQVYGILYNRFAPIDFIIDWKLGILSLAVSLICSAGATWFACYTELVQMPAALMRPKAPKSGKKIWMEKLPFLWKRMKFLHKVSARNIFRFKKRMFMMLLGIGGCTALIVTGFGVSDSIINIASDQYDNILTYDYSITLKEPADEGFRQDFQENTADILSTSVFVGTETVDALYEGGTKKVNIIACSDMKIEDVTGLSYKGKPVEYPKDGEVIISNSISEASGVKIGDTLTLKISDTETRDVVVGGIFQNYVYHYMFMTEETYRQVFGKNCEYKTILATAKDKGALYETSALLSSSDSENPACFGDDIEQISVTNDFKVRVKNMLGSLNYVIILVIFCACALAFVVLYNLSNINITERVREIATIKVLGFYPIETNSYVFRENIVLTIMGTVIGLPAGWLLHNFVMHNIRIEMVCFHIRILPQTYAYACLITLIMAVLVDLVLIPKIEQVNMTESLKSVE